jgi:hypothetical protein
VEIRWSSPSRSGERESDERNSEQRDQSVAVQEEEEGTRRNDQFI